MVFELEPADGRAPVEQERILLEELRRYRPSLLGRPRLVVGSKADLAPSALDWDGPRISALTGAGIPRLLGRLSDLVESARAEQAPPARFVVHRPEPAGIAVERDSDGGWTVLGRPAQRAVALSDLTNPEAIAYAQGRLRRLGVDRALARAGARTGDRVSIGGFVFEYQTDDGLEGGR